MSDNIEISPDNVGSCLATALVAFLKYGIVIVLLLVIFWRLGAIEGEQRRTRQAICQQSTQTDVLDRSACG